MTNSSSDRLVQTQSEKSLPHDTRFKCNGDYCFVTTQDLVPKHISPVVSQLLQYQLPRVGLKTIHLERDNIRDNYRQLE